MVLHGNLLWVREESEKLLMKVKRSPNRIYKITLEDNNSVCLMAKTEEGDEETLVAPGNTTGNTERLTEMDLREPFTPSSLITPAVKREPSSYLGETGSMSTGYAPRKLRSSTKVYENSEEVELSDELLLLRMDEPSIYGEAAKYPMELKLQLSKDENGEPVNATNYRCIMGSLRYLMHTRPDLAYAV